MKEKTECKTSSLSGQAAGDSSCCGETQANELPVKALKVPETGESSDGAVCNLEVGGMDCPSCADDITRALGKLEVLFFTAWLNFKLTAPVR